MCVPANLQVRTCVYEKKLGRRLGKYHSKYYIFYGTQRTANSDRNKNPELEFIGETFF